MPILGTRAPASSDRSPPGSPYRSRSWCALNGPGRSARRHRWPPTKPT